MRKLIIVACVLALLALLATATTWATTGVGIADLQATIAPDSQQDVHQAATRGSPSDEGQQVAGYDSTITADQSGTATADDDHARGEMKLKWSSVATPTSGARGSPITDNVESTITPTTPVAQSADIWQARQAVAYQGAGTIAEQSQQALA